MRAMGRRDDLGEPARQEAFGVHGGEAVHILEAGGAGIVPRVRLDPDGKFLRGAMHRDHGMDPGLRLDRFVQAVEGEAGQGDAGLLFHLAADGSLQPLAEANAPAGQAPQALKRRVGALDEQHLAGAEDAGGNPEDGGLALGRGSGAGHLIGRRRREVVRQGAGRLTRAARSGSRACMCGRYTLTATPQEVAEVFGLDELDGFPPRYNIAPTQPILVVLGGRDARPEAMTEGREGRLVRWGFLPGWLKDAKGFPLAFNARSETAAEKPSFRGAMRHRRCLVPASGFYEWRRDGKGAKGQPYFVRPRQPGPIGFGGIVETWHAADGSEIDTAAILTTSANAALSSIHERMPVVIAPDQMSRWLDCRAFEPREVADLMAPSANDTFDAVAVSDLVNKVAHVGPQIQAPIGLAEKRQSEKPEGPAQGRLF